MKQNSDFSIWKRIKSFKYALKGIQTMFQTEHNSWIHLFTAILVSIAGIFFEINFSEWCFLILAIGFVFMTEIINTAIEKLTDLVSPNYHPLAQKVKDLAAGGVLIASFTALLIGVFIFGNKVYILILNQIH
ncbi:MAG: diacylglycerol kinase family protein [Flavobacteriia bacterium]|nr:diacylglycerol kinase family protein [Flavobacteriia bacterium]